MRGRKAGRYWERRAGEYLRGQGLRVLEAAYQCRFGEIDLICADGATLVIVEVRARSSGSLVSALESIDAAKRRKIVQATRHLLMRRPHWSQRPLRFDVVAIDAIDDAQPRIEWLRGAFDAG